MPASSASAPSRIATRAQYEDNVFVNCPFDEKYRPLFEAIVFAVHACGFYARSALEFADSAENRLDKILRIIEGCRFGIHDISRTDLGPAGLPRFNMPLELGLFLGCRRYGSPRDRRKICLVFDTERHRYQQFISDISGQDVTPHGGDPARAVRGVSEWFRSSSGRRSILGGTEILRRFEEFRAELPAMSARVHLTVDELTFADRTQLISRWLIEDSRLR